MDPEFNEFLTKLERLLDSRGGRDAIEFRTPVSPESCLIREINRLVEQTLDGISKKLDAIAHEENYG